MTQIFLDAQQDFKRLDSFVSKYFQYQTSYYQDSVSKLMQSTDADLSSYSEHSRKNSQFLSKFFSIPTTDQNYIHIDRSMFSDPYFLSTILNSGHNYSLLLLFDENLLDEDFEKAIIEKYAAKNYPTPLFQYCGKEFFMKDKSWDDGQIKTFVYKTILQNNQNIEYLPESLKKNDNVLLDMINNNSYTYMFFEQNSRRFQKLPTSIFNFRDQAWWNSHPEVFLKVVELGKGVFSNEFFYKNIKQNDFYQFLIMQEYPSIFRKSKNITENQVLSILAAQHISDFYPNIEMNSDLFKSQEIIDLFLKDLDFYSFDNKSQTQADYFSKRTSNPSKEFHFYPSKKMSQLLSQILSSLTEEQYLSMNIFKETNVGNPLLTLASLNKEFKIPNHMLKDVIFATHQNLYLNQNDKLYGAILLHTFEAQYKVLKEIFPIPTEKRNITSTTVIQDIIPTIEDVYLNEKIPQNTQSSSKVLKF